MFANIIKTFPKLGVDNIPTSLLQQADSMISATSKYTEWTAEQANLLKKMDNYSFLKSFIDEGSNKLKQEELFSNIKQNVKEENYKGFFEEKIDLSYQGAFSVKEKLINTFQRTLHDLDYSVSALQKHYFNLAVYNPDALFKKTGISQRDIFMALKGRPNHINKDNAKFLSKLSSSYSKIDSDFMKLFSDVSNIGNLSEYVLPVRFFSEDLLKIQDNELAKIFIQYTNIKDPKEALSLAKQIQKSILDTSKGKPFRLSSKGRNLQFDSLDAEFDFLSAINAGWTNGNTLLQHVINTKEKGAIRGMFYKDFGASPYENIEEVLKRLKTTDYEEDLASIRLKLDLAFNRNVFEKGPIKTLTDAVDKFFSAIYGAPVSLLRQIFIDATGHSTAIKDYGFHKSQSSVFMKDKVIKPLIPLFKNIGDPEVRTHLNDLLNDLGASAYNSAFFKTFGFGFRNAVEVEGISKKSDLEYIFSYLDYLAGKLNENIHTWAGNIFHYDAVNAINMLNNSTSFTNLVLKKHSYQDIIKAMGPKAKYLKEFFNIGENEFLALQKVQPVKLSSQKYEKFIGIRKDMEAITIDQILDLDDDIAFLYKKKHETTKGFKQRLALSYIQLMADQLQTHQSHITRTRLFSDKYVKRGTFLDLILRPTVFKFMNITDVQYKNLRRAVGVYKYGSPFEGKEYMSFNNSEIFKAWAEIYGWYTAGALGLIWFKDALHGRRLRPLNMDTFMYAEIQSGMFGVPGMVFEMGSNMLQHGQPKTVAESYIKTLKKGFQGDPEKAIKRTSGVGHIWYVSPVLDRVLNRSNYKNKIQDYEDRTLRYL